MSLYAKVASLLEALADEIETRPDAPAKVAEAPASPRAEDPAAKVATLFREAAGEVIDPEVAAKLASEPQVLAALDKLAASAARPTPLGEPSEKDAAEGAPAERPDERRRAAYDRFGNFLLGNS